MRMPGTLQPLVNVLAVGGLAARLVEWYLNTFAQVMAVWVVTPFGRLMLRAHVGLRSS